MNKIIMTVDDSPSIRQMVGYTLTQHGHSVIEACDGRDALAKLSHQPVHLIITDLKLPDTTGLDLMGRFREAGFRGHAILISAYPDLLNIDQLTRNGISYYFTKPLDLDLFSRSIDQLLEPKEGVEKRA